MLPAHQSVSPTGPPKPCDSGQIGKIIRATIETSPFGGDSVPGSLWKPHKSKERKILHKSYIIYFFSTPKKNFFFRVEKKSEKKIEHFLKFSKFRKFSMKNDMIFH